MGFTGCIQGQGEGNREPPVLVPILEGIPQDVLENFRAQESQEGFQNLRFIPEVEQSTQLYSGEMREFLPSSLGDLDWSSGERSLSGDLPPFATASDPGPAHSASPPLQRSSDLHDRATTSIPDRFPTSSLSRHGSLSEPP